MRNTFGSLKQVLVCCAVAFFLPNVKAQRMEAAPKMLAEYELVNDVELFSSGKTNFNRIYRKKATAAPTRKAEMPRGKDTDIEPPLVIIVDENGCETGCTEHGWGSMGCMFKNPENIPTSFRLGGDGYFYEENKRAPISNVVYSKFEIAKSTNDNKVLPRKQNAGSPTEPSSFWITFCNPPGMNCRDHEILEFSKTKPKTGAPLQNFSDGTVSFRFVDSKIAFCLRPDGSVSHCDWLPASEEIAKMRDASTEKDQQAFVGWKDILVNPIVACWTKNSAGQLSCTEVSDCSYCSGICGISRVQTYQTASQKRQSSPPIKFVPNLTGLATAVDFEKSTGTTFFLSQDPQTGAIKKLAKAADCPQDQWLITLEKTTEGNSNNPQYRRAAPDLLPNFGGNKNTGRSNTSGCCLKLIVAPSSTGGVQARRAAPVPTEKAVFGGVKPGSEVKVTVVDDKGAVVDAALWSVKNTESAMSVDLSKLPASSYTIQVRAGAQVEIYDFGEVGLPPQLVSRWTVSDNQPAQHHWCGDKRAFVEYCEDCAGECDVYLSTASERGNVTELAKPGKLRPPEIDKKALSALVKSLGPKETTFNVAVDQKGNPRKITKLADCPVGTFLFQFQRDNK